MHHLHDFLSSGNGYKVRLLLTQLNIPFRYHEHDVMQGATHTPDFLKMNPNGKIPVLVMPDNKILFESNAILTYLAEGTDFLPSDSWERALVMQWLFWEQYSHEPYIATSRFWTHLMNPDDFRDKLNEARPKGLKALNMMEDHLSANPFFVGGRYTIADIALYAYTHVSHEGGFSLEPFPAIRAWLGRVKEQPNHITIDYKPQ